MPGIWRLMTTAGAAAVAALAVAPAGASAIVAGHIYTLAGNGSSSADGVPASAASFDPAPTAVAAGPADSIYVAEQRRVRRIGSDGLITTIAGTGATGSGGDDGSALAATFTFIRDLLVLPDQSILVADWGAGKIRRIALDGTISTLAGAGPAGDSGDDGPALSAQITPIGLARRASDGAILVAGGSTNRVRQIAADGTISAFAGTGASGSSGDGGPAVAARLQQPSEVSVTADGSVLIADAWNGRVRHVDPSGTITTVAGAEDGSVGEGAQATSGRLAGPFEVLALADGGFLVGESYAPKVRRVLPDGRMVTVAGTGQSAYGGDAGPASAASFQWVNDIEQTPVGLFIAEASGRLRVVAAGNGLRLYDRTPPLAALSVTTRPILTGEETLLDASASSDDVSGIEEYLWDLDGDGRPERRTTTPTLRHSFAQAGTQTVAVSATDGSGNTGAPALATITVLPRPPAGLPGISINAGATFTNRPQVSVWVVWPPYASDVVLSNDGGFRPASQRGVAERLTWTLNSSGPERLPKTVYARFVVDGAVGAQTYQDDIILDQTPPAVTRAEVASAASARGARALGHQVRRQAAATRRARPYRLQVSARDRTSGVRLLQVASAGRKRVSKPVAYRKRLMVRWRLAPRFVRARDGAGNWSAWRPLRPLSRGARS